MSNRNNPNLSKLNESSIFQQQDDELEYQSKEDITVIGEEDMLLDQSGDIEISGEEFDEEDEYEDDEEQEKKPMLKKKTTEDFDGALQLKGINFKKGMDKNGFSLLKKNLVRTKKKQKKKKLLKKITTALKDVVQVDDFENFKTPASQKDNFIQPKKQILEQIQLKGDFLGKINKFIRDISKEAKDNLEFTAIMANLRIMIEGLFDVNFNWELYENSIPQINDLFELVLSIVQENFHYNFFDLNPFIQKLPIGSMLKFFQYPLYDTSNWKLQETVNRFFVNILCIFRNFYFKSCMMSRQVINIKQIQVIDPFLRTSIRKNNLEYFKENFWAIKDFELYDFIYELIDKMILTILPKFKYEQKKPLIVYILQLILDMYRFGLVTYIQNRKMLSYMHLIAEVLIGYEQWYIDQENQLKLDNIEREKNGQKKQFLKLPKKLKENFLECKEDVCSILIHQAAIFCDITFEEALQQTGEIKYDFQNYLMNDQTSFVYFSSIAIKYLSQYLQIQGKEITSEWLKEGLAIIYNFIGDDQNDFFIQSLYLLKKGLFEHYYQVQYLNQKCNDTDANTVIRLTNNFLARLKQTQRKKFQTELQMYFQSIMPIFEQNLQNKDFNFVLSKNNFPYFILMFLYYLDSIDTNSDLYYHGFFVLQTVLKNNYTGQGIIFRGDCINFFRQLMLNRNFECMVIIKEVFSNDPFVLFISPSIFKFNLNIYSQFLEKLTQKIRKKNYSKSTRSLIGVLFFFSFYFMNVLEDHDVKNKQRRKFHLIIAEELSDFFKEFVFEQYFISDANFEMDKTLTDILSYKLEDLHKFQKLISTIDCQAFLKQFYYIVFKLFNKATYKEYSGNVCSKIFDDLFYVQIKPQDNINKFTILERLEKIKLRCRFMVFFSNNLLTQREIYNPKHTLICGEQCIPEKHYYHIFDIIFDEFDFLFKYKKQFPEITLQDSAMVNQYLFKGLLGVIYKYLKGIRLHFYNFADIPDLQQLKDFMSIIPKRIKDLDQSNPEFKKQREEFNFIYSEIFNTDDFFKNIAYAMKKDQYEMQLCICHYMIFNLQKLKNIIYDNLSIFNLSRNQKINFEKIDDAKIMQNRKPDIVIKKENINFIYFKDCIKDLISEILGIIRHKYNNTKFQYIIDRYELKSLANREINNKFKFARSIRTKFKEELKAHQKIKKTLYKKLLTPFKRAYKMHKKQINEQGEKNQFLIVLVNDKDLSKNLRNLMYYFIERINEMSVLLNQKDFDKQFLNNDYYTYLIIIVDNLMSWKKKIKDFFLELIYEESEQGKRAKKVIQTLSECQYILYKIILFKTFQDDLWADYWTKYYVISKFMQNLCQDNNADFKQILSTYEYAPGVLQLHGNRAANYKENQRYFYFFELYIFCEISASENPAWFNRNHEILLEDKPYQFQIMQRLIEQITEHVQGPYLDNQDLVYRYRPDIWQGIMTRIIDDIDDNFYQLSIAVVLYFDALIEGLDDTIVSFISSNVNIDEFFNVICRLIHKLYIRQLRYTDQDKKFLQNQNQNFDKQQLYNDIDKNQSFSYVTKESEQAINIESSQSLLDMYQSYENFTDHQVLKYAINLYIFLINLSIKIKFFNFFLKEKESKAKKYNNNKNYRNKHDQEQKNEINSIVFLKQIISSIEIVYTRDQEQYLQEVFFQKPPECFFLGFITKQNFINNMNIETVKSVHLDLFSSVPHMHYEMLAKRKDFIRMNYLFYFTTAEFFRRVHQFLYLLSFILNVLMTNSIVFTHFDDEEADVTGARINTDANEVLIRTIGLIIAIMSSFFSILWIIFRYKKMRKIRIIQETSWGKNLTFFDNLSISLWHSLFANGRFISFFLHAVFSFLGVFLNYFYFTLNLFLISNLSNTISYVMKSLVEHKQKFMIVFVLTLMVIFSYSFLMVRHFSDLVNAEQFGDNVCTDFFSCYFNSVNLGMRLGGGISDPLVLSANPNGGVFWGRFFFDISFFFIVKMVLLNVIAGIIIDAFNELRDELNQRSYHKNNVCFICGLTKWQIEKKGNLHQDHIEDQHNIWNYLFFMTKLQSNEVSNFNGLEYSIYTKYKDDDTSWIPQGIFLDNNSNYMIVPKKD